MRSGVVVPTTIRSSDSALQSEASRAARAACSARSQVVSCSPAMRRSTMPVRSRIHASEVSSEASNSLFGTTRSGR